MGADTMKQRPATTTIRFEPEDRARLERIAEHDGQRLALDGPAPLTAVVRRLVREEAERLERAAVQREQVR